MVLHFVVYDYAVNINTSKDFVNKESRILAQHNFNRHLQSSFAKDTRLSRSNRNL